MIAGGVGLLRGCQSLSDTRALGRARVQRMGEQEGMRGESCGGLGGETTHVGMQRTGRGEASVFCS